MSAFGNKTNKQIIDECSNKSTNVSRFSIEDLHYLVDSNRYEAANFIVCRQMEKYSPNEREYFLSFWHKFEVASRTGEDHKIKSVLSEIIKVNVNKENWEYVESVLFDNLFALGFYKECLEIFNKFAKFTTKFQKYLNLIILNIYLDKFSQAEKVFKEADEDSYDDEAGRNLFDGVKDLLNCLYFFKKEEYKKVIELCETKPNDASFFTFYQIASSISLKDYKYSNQIIKLVLDEEPPFYEKAAIYKAYIEYLKGNHSEALNILEKYEKKIPAIKDYTFFYVTKGKCYQGLGQFDEAVNNLNTAYSMFYCVKKFNDENWNILFDDQVAFMKKVIENDRVDLVKKLVSLGNLEKRVEESVKTDEKKMKQLNDLKQVRKNLVTEAFSNTSNNETSQLEKKIKDLETRMNSLMDIIEESGLKAKVDVKRGFKQLLDEDRRLYEYARAFYWTLLNYFQAYRIVSTELANKNIDYQEKGSENLIAKGLGKVASFVAETGKDIPIVGSILSVIDGLVDSIYSAIKEKRFDNKMNAINKIITQNNDPNALFEEELNIANGKKWIIFTPPKPPKESILEYISNKISEAKDYFLTKKVDVYESEHQALALRDSALCMGYMYLNYEFIINSKFSLSEQFTNIVLEGKHEKMLENGKISKESNEGGEKVRQTFC